MGIDPRVVAQVGHALLVHPERDPVAAPVAPATDEDAGDVHHEPIDDVKVDDEPLLLGVPEEDRAVARARALHRDVEDPPLEALDLRRVERAIIL